ncbi:MAG: hypothetical protein L6Q97_09465 [Thermoanaerobaculia bacterium]|nr:hypothetical protein [Thermoanaerobaculia bacterium]
MPTHHDPTPPDCFRLEELEAFQSFENQLLSDVNYYLWLNRAEAGEAPLRFLYVLELVFEQPEALLLSSGEDSEAIRVIAPEALIDTARRLQTLHGRVSVQRVSAGAFPLWQPVVGRALESIRLSKKDNGLYLNDMLLLDFGFRQIMVQLGRREGLEMGVFSGE